MQKIVGNSKLKIPSMKIQKAENMKLLPLALLLIITPLLSTSLRFKYLYFIVNILIISVGVEAGLFSFFLHSEENRTPPVSSLLPLPLKSASDDALRKPVKECALEPSIFFIQGGESEDEDEDNKEKEEEEEEDGDDDELMVEENNGEDHELYHKSEKFIGNFYKQLKMQREESWNEFH